MKKTLLLSMIAAAVLTGGTAGADSLPVELVLGEGRVWKGRILSRDGDWIEFVRGISTQPIRIGVNTIQSINFRVNVDADQINELMAQREFDKLIEAVKGMLEPFDEFRDIPSNLTRYEAALMELYYNTEEYDKSLAISEKIIEDDRFPALQEKARIYQTLAQIDSGNTDAAQTLMVKYGWNEQSTRDTAPEELYIRSKFMMMKEEYRSALLEAAKVVVFHSQNQDWMKRAELLCAELYSALEMYDSAEEVCRQIVLMYKDTPEFDEARELMAQIDKLRAEQ